MPTDKERIEEQKKIIDELTAHAARYELLAHELRQTQNELDIQINTYGLIHKYTQMAFDYEEEDLFNIISEGVVDVFQLEIGAVYRIDLEKNALIASGSCNLPDEAIEIPIPGSHDWLTMWGQRWEDFTYESPVSNPLWKSFEMSTVITYVFENNKKQPVGVVLGAISKSSEAFFEFSKDISKSSFIVFCKQMNGIYNNFEAIKQARQAGEAKSRFLANLSHEIRTPMNAILGMARIAENSDDMEEIMRCVKQIDGSSHHLLGLINDVLDISKVEEGKLSLSYKEFKLREMLDRLLNSITPQVNSRKQNLKISMDTVTGDNYIGDSLRLSQVLINILSNAIKFTPEKGNISLDIVEIKKDMDKVLLMFSVTDTGIGIEKDQVDAIFKPFEQADGSISRKYGGTGLGLAISQRIIELMGGEIKVESEVGKGTTFSFNIWIDTVAESISPEDSSIEEPGKKQEAVDLSDAKILVVDDVDINREIIKAFLEPTKVKIDEAEDGQQAVNMFESSAPGEYSLILMDVQMPLKDGCSATEEIRKLDRTDAKSIPIYAMTANVFKEDVQQVVNAGMNGHIGKPVDYDVVLKTTVDAVGANK